MIVSDLMTDMPAFKTIALIGRYQSSGVSDSLRKLGAFLRDRGCEVLLEKETVASSGVREFPGADYATVGAQASSRAFCASSQRSVAIAWHCGQQRW